MRLVGMMLIVYVNDDHASHISEVSSDTAGTGIMGMLGNKGGVAVRQVFHTKSQKSNFETESTFREFNPLGLRFTTLRFVSLIHILLPTCPNMKEETR